jgi:hypothetical protein
MSLENLTPEEVEARLAELDDMRDLERIGKLNEQLQEWVEHGKPEALIEEAKTLMMADAGAPTQYVFLSEHGVSRRYTVTDLVKRLVNVTPGSGVFAVSEFATPAEPDEEDDRRGCVRSSASRSPWFVSAGRLTASGCGCSTRLCPTD